MSLRPSACSTQIRRAEAGPSPSCAKEFETKDQILCQYTDRCPVRHHKPGTKCKYTRNPRTRSNPARSSSNRYRPSNPPPVRSVYNVEPESPARNTPNYPSRQKSRRVHHDQNRQTLTDGMIDAVTEATVTYVLQPDGVYELVADHLLSRTRAHRRFKHPRGHWLCVVLNNAARSCETGTYIDLVSESVEKGLCEEYGIPRVVAKVLTECAAASAKLLLAHTVFGPANFPTVLRALIALVCPNLDRCPTQGDVRTALLGPLAAKSLRAAVVGPSPGRTDPIIL